MIALLEPFLPYIICLVAFSGAYLWANEGWHNAVARRAEAKIVAIQAQRDKAQAAFADVVRDSEGSALTRMNHDDAAAAALRVRLGNLPTVANCYMSVDTLGVLNAATGFANSTSDSASGSAPPNSVPVVPAKPL